MNGYYHTIERPGYEIYGWIYTDPANMELRVRDLKICFQLDVEWFDVSAQDNEKLKEIFIDDYVARK